MTSWHCCELCVQQLCSIVYSLFGDIVERQALPCKYRLSAEIKFPLAVFPRYPTIEESLWNFHDPFFG